MKEFTLRPDGSCVLSDDGDVIWSSDNDDDFQAEFGECIDPEDIDEVLEYLTDIGALYRNDPIDIIDETPDDDDETPDDDGESEELH